MYELIRLAPTEILAIGGLVVLFLIAFVVKEISVKIENDRIIEPTPTRTATKKNLTDIWRESQNEKRMRYHDTILKNYYTIILMQCRNNDRSDDVLIDYINELEYRGLKYEDPTKG